MTTPHRAFIDALRIVLGLDPLYRAERTDTIRIYPDDVEQLDQGCRRVQNCDRFPWGRPS